MSLPWRATFAQEPHLLAWGINKLLVLWRDVARGQPHYADILPPLSYAQLCTTGRRTAPQILEELGGVGMAVSTKTQLRFGDSKHNNRPSHCPFVISYKAHFRTEPHLIAAVPVQSHRQSAAGPAP